MEGHTAHGSLLTTPLLWTVMMRAILITTSRPSHATSLLGDASFQTIAAFSLAIAPSPHEVIYGRGCNPEQLAGMSCACIQLASVSGWCIDKTSYVRWDTSYSTVTAHRTLFVTGHGSTSSHIEASPRDTKSRHRCPRCLKATRSHSPDRLCRQAISFKQTTAVSSSTWHHFHREST